MCDFNLSFIANIKLISLLDSWNSPQSLNRVKTYQCSGVRTHLDLPFKWSPGRSHRKLPSAVDPTLAIFKERIQFSWKTHTRIQNDKTTWPRSSASHPTHAFSPKQAALWLHEGLTWTVGVRTKHFPKWLSKWNEHPSDGVPQTRGALTLFERCLVWR